MERTRKSKETWTDANDARFEELFSMLSRADYPGEYFDEQCELTDLREKALRLDMSPEPLPW